MSDTFENSIVTGGGRPESALSRKVTLQREDWRQIDTAIPDLIELIGDVKNVLQDLSYAEDMDREGMRSILRLAGRAVSYSPTLGQIWG